MRRRTVFAADPDGAVQFHPLPPPWDHDVTRLLGQIVRAIHRLVERYLALRDGDHAPPELLASEQAEAVSSPPSLGGAALPSGPTAHRVAFLGGYSLYAARLVDADDRDGLERLCRYGARSPIANARLAVAPTGQVILGLKRPLRDGRAALAFTPLELRRRLVTLIPPPRSHPAATTLTVVTDTLLLTRADTSVISLANATYFARCARTI